MIGAGAWLMSSASSMTTTAAALDWIVHPFELGFMRRALLAGLLAVIAGAVVGTWVVIRGLSFMGEALSHGVLPGIAVAFTAGVSLVLGAAVGAAVMVLGIAFVRARTRVGDDTAIALLFVGMLALGVIIVSTSRSYTTNLTSFLFGDILGVSNGDLVLQAVVAVGAIAVVCSLYRAFIALSLDEEQAALLGLRPRLAHLAMLVLVAACIVSSFKAVGTLLVFGLLVAPPATASLVARRVPTMMLAAVAFGVVAVVSGLVLSYHQGTAAGATIAGLAVAEFFVVLSLGEVTNAMRRAR